MKLIVNKIFSLILSAYFIYLYFISSNLLFMAYSIVSIMMYFVINHVIKTYELKTNLDKILNYVFFYLDDEAQQQIFNKHRHSQIVDLVNIWFIVDQYSKKKFKTYSPNSWKLQNSKLIDENKALVIKDYLIKNKDKLSNVKTINYNKKKFISYIMKNIKKEQAYQEIFEEIERKLKEDPRFLEKLNNKVKKLPPELDQFAIPQLSMFLETEEK